MTCDICLSYSSPSRSSYYSQESNLSIVYYGDTLPPPPFLFFGAEHLQPMLSACLGSGRTFCIYSRPFPTQHLCTAEFREILYKIYIVLIFFLEIVLLKIVQSACLYSDCSYFLTFLMPTFLEVGIVLCLRGVHVSSFHSAYELVNASSCAR